MTLPTTSSAPRSVKHEPGQFVKARLAARDHETDMRGRAAICVAENSVNSEDCSQLLSMLGLEGDAADLDSAGFGELEVPADATVAWNGQA